MDSYRQIVGTACIDNDEKSPLMDGHTSSSRLESYRVILTFQSADSSLQCDYSNETFETTFISR